MLCHLLSGFVRYIVRSRDASVERTEDPDMPKAENGYDLERYAPVARRITHFYERYPAGRIITSLVARGRSPSVRRARLSISRRCESGRHGVGARA